MKETLHQSNFSNFLRNKVAKPAGKLAAGATAGALAFGTGGCSAKESHLVELSIGVRCSESVDGGGKPGTIRQQYKWLRKRCRTRCLPHS